MGYVCLAYKCEQDKRVNKMTDDWETLVGPAQNPLSRNNPCMT